MSEKAERQTMKKGMTIALMLLLALVEGAQAATRTIADGGGNWSANGTWVEGAAPTSSDDVVATATSGQVTVNTSSCVCKSIVLTGYTNTLTFTASQMLSVSGNVTFVSGMTLSGTGILNVIAAATLTSGGLTFPGAVTLTTANTYTLGDDWTITGLLTTGNVSTTTINSNNLYLNGGWTCTAATAGTTAITLQGTGTWTGSSTVASTRKCSLPITVNTAGTITLASNIVLGGNTVTYTSGTITPGTSIIALYDNTTFSGAWPSLYDFRTYAATTLTINNNITFTGTILLFDNLTISGAYTVTCGTLTNSGASVTLTRSAAWTITTLQVATSLSFTLGGAYDQTVTNCYVRAGGTLKLPNSQTLTVTSVLDVASNPNLVATISSTTASTNSNINHSGTANNCKSYAAAYTDITATGNPIKNYCGGTLTRTSGITNYLPSDIGSGSGGSTAGMISVSE